MQRVSICVLLPAQPCCYSLCSQRVNACVLGLAPCLLLSPAHSLSQAVNFQLRPGHYADVLLLNQPVLPCCPMQLSCTGANLCATTLRSCPGYTENYAFHTLMATSYFRMLQSNIPANL
jgi:hypothetical protein